jgi:hypothetical protein
MMAICKWSGCSDRAAAFYLSYVAVGVGLASGGIELAALLFAGVRSANFLS